MPTGDGWVGEEVLHILRLLELLNRTDVRVVPGAPGPLLPLTREEVALRTQLYGGVSWEGAWARPGAADPFAINTSHFPEGMPRAKPYTAEGSAAEFIARSVRASPGEITLLSLGPMTNLANAIAIEPLVPSLAKELVAMGGSFGCGLASADASSHCDLGPFPSEFNLWFDPEAAKKVVRSVAYVTRPWRRLVLLPADVASQAMWTASMQHAVATAAPVSAAARYITTYLIPSVNVAFPMFDEFAVVTTAVQD